MSSKEKKLDYELSRRDTEIVNHGTHATKIKVKDMKLYLYLKKKGKKKNLTKKVNCLEFKSTRTEMKRLSHLYLGRINSKHGVRKLSHKQTLRIDLHHRRLSCFYSL